MKVIKSGEIVRCICYNDQTVTVEASKGELSEINLDQVASLTTSELNSFFTTGRQASSKAQQTTYPD